MNAYGAGNQPLGLNWYRLLSIYSELGSSANSHDKICNIGQELKKLDGKHDAAIKGINDKLNSLIQAGNVKLSGEDLSSLKEALVEGLAEHAEKSADRCAAPVVSDGESLIFTDDVKEVLASLVRQKAAVLRDVDLESMASDITSIRRALANHEETSEDRNEKLVGTTGALISEMWGTTTQVEEFRKLLAEMTSTDNTFGTALAETVVQKLGGRGGWGSLSDVEKGDLATAIAEKVVKLATISRKRFEEGEGEEKRRGGGEREAGLDVPEGYDADIYSAEITQVIEWFKKGDSRLLIGIRNRGKTAERLSKYRRTAGAQEAEISEEELTSLVLDRMDAQITLTPRFRQKMPEKTRRYLEDTKAHLPIERLRLMHSFFADLTDQPR